MYDNTKFSTCQYFCIYGIFLVAPSHILIVVSARFRNPDSLSLVTHYGKPTINLAVWKIHDFGINVCRILCRTQSSKKLALTIWLWPVKCTRVTRLPLFNFWRNGTLKLYVQNIQCFRILVVVHVSSDFPGKRTMAKDGLLLLQDDEDSGCHPSQG